MAIIDYFMEQIQYSNVRKGQHLMVLALGFLILLRIVLAIMVSTVADWVDYDQFDEVYWYLVPAVILLGAGTYHGSKPIKYVFAALLVVSVALEIYLFSYARFPGNWVIAMSLQAWLVSGLVIYLSMFDDRVENFFRVQRSRHYGEPVKVVGMPAPKTKVAQEAQVKSSGNTADELGIFED